MKGERDERARAKVLAELAAGRSVTAAAKAAGVARTTPYQWADRGDDQMREALESARKGRPVEGTPSVPCPQGPPSPKRLHKDERLAIQTLRAVARGERDGKECAPGAHVAAARALLEHHRKRRQDAEATKIGAPPPVSPEGEDEGEDVGALITRIRAARKA